MSLLDTACARVAVGRFAMPAEVEDCQHRIEALKAELEILEREAAVGLDNATRESAPCASASKSSAAETRIAARGLEAREVPGRADHRAALAAAGGRRGATATRTSREPRRLRRAWNELQRELEARAGQAARFCSRRWTQPTVASVVADWTGIPVGRMVKRRNRRGAHARRHARASASSARTTRSKRSPAACRPRAPVSKIRASRIGVFLLAGPSGVGKTETALALAEALYGGEQNLITINMSEFQESHTVSTLKGSPPGYVGYGEGGVLTEAVRRKPYSVVLLDEVEKAHPDVHEIFYQVFDKGVMEDGEGRQIDFRNTLIILTTNVGSDLHHGRVPRSAAAAG